MWTGKMILRPGLKSTESLFTCWFATRLVGLLSYSVVVLISVTLIFCVVVHIYDERDGPIRTSADPSTGG
jgi:hypothetical protein